MEQKQTGKGGFSVIEGVSGSGKTTLLKNIEDFYRLFSMPIKMNGEPTTHNSFGRVIREVIEGRKPDAKLIINVTNATTGFVSDVKNDDRILGCSPADMRIVVNFYNTVMLAVSELKAGEIPAPREFQALYVVDRYYNLRNCIIPAMKNGYWNWNDRFLLSTFAYGMAYGVSIDEIYDWHRCILGDSWFLPNSTFYIKVSAATATERLYNSGKTIDIWEKKEKLQALIDCYESSIAFLKGKYAELDIPDTFHIIDGEVSEEKVFAQVREIILK